MKKISSIIKLSVVCALILGAFNVSLPVLDVSAVSAKEQAQKGAEATELKGSSPDVPGIIKTVVNTMLFLVGALAVIMIIYGGILYTTSGGDSKRVEKAKNTLVYSIVGLVVAIFAYAVVYWVTDVAGGAGSSGGSGGSSSGASTVAP